MTRRSRPLNLFLVLALLLGTALPLLHAASAEDGLWTTSCKGRALFVPISKDSNTDHVRCLICLAEHPDDFAVVPRRELSAVRGAIHPQAIELCAPVKTSAANSQPIRAPPILAAAS